VGAALAEVITGLGALWGAFAYATLSEHSAVGSGLCLLAAAVAFGFLLVSQRPRQP
jgi:hypothetical protein